MGVAAIDNADLWTQIDVDQPSMRDLSQRNTRRKWDHFVCVSDWHRRTVIEAFALDAARVSVMRNAIAPVFEGLFASREALSAAKADGLRLAYTSTPYRGLDLLLDIFPAFRSSNPTARLEVYSSMAVYQHSLETDKYRPLYDTLGAMDGVEYVGSLPQPELAKRLAQCHILSYPNTFAETSCFSVMEALAAGLLVVTSDLGALPETTQGFARLVPTGMSREEYLNCYSNALAGSYSLSEQADQLYRQVVAMNERCTWRVRAHEWSEFLERQLSASSGMHA